MKRFYLLHTVFFLFSFFTGYTQTVSTQKGLTTAVFNLPEGIIRVWLPNDIRPGETISGTIAAEPFGRNTKQSARNLDELKKYQVNFDGQKFSVTGTGIPVQYRMSDTKMLQRFLSVINKEGVNAGEVSIPVPYNSSATQETGCRIPTHALTAAPMRIPGSFDGNSSNTRCRIGNAEAMVLAESPRQCIVQFPADRAGTQQTELKENEKTLCNAPVSPVDMQVTTGRLNLRRGERSFIRVQITGLQQLPDTARLILNNISTDVVQMQPSDKYTVQLVPDSMTKGSYEETFDVQSIKPGSFTVLVDLDLPEPPVYGTVKTGVEQPPVYADNNGVDVGGIKLHPLKVDGLKNGMSDAFKKAVTEITGNRANKYPELDGCGSCLTCIQSMLDEGKVALVGEIGKILMEHYVDLLVGKAGGALAWIKDKFDKLEKAEDIAGAISDAVKKGEIQVVEFPEKMCGYCLVSAIGFYDAKTQCMDAFFYCKGSKMCCTHALTIIHLKYCVNNDGFMKPGTGLDIDVISR